MDISIVKNFFTKGDKRSILLKRNIIGSFILKGISIIISFVMIPVTIDFINPTQYGIWLTLSSLMSWFFFFDIGLGLGFRNRYTEAMANENIPLARAYLSTTYASIAIISFTLLTILLPINYHLNWSEILNLPKEYSNELGNVFGLMIIFFSVNLVAQVFNTLLAADQRPVISSFIQVSGQGLCLLIIFILSKFTQKGDGSLYEMVYVFSGIPIFVLLISTIALFITRYRHVHPTLNSINFKLIKNILGMGFQFFIITTSMLFIFQLMNVIISRELGPEDVTEYNVSFKYFNIVFMVMTLILNPFWSAFTDAYTRGDTPWMESKLKYLEKLGLLLIPVLGLMLLLSGWFIKVWIKGAVTVDFSINVSMAIYILLLSISNIYMYILNGTGKVKIQLIIYLIFALIAFPSMSYFCRNYGIPGLLLIPCIVYLLQAIFANIQIRKLIHNKAHGIWFK